MNHHTSDGHDKISSYGRHITYMLIIVLKRSSSSCSNAKASRCRSSLLYLIYIHEYVFFLKATKHIHPYDTVGSQGLSNMPDHRHFA